jgi:hypothetical protein
VIHCLVHSAEGGDEQYAATLLLRTWFFGHLATGASDVLGLSAPSPDGNLRMLDNNTKRAHRHLCSSK